MFTPPVAISAAMAQAAMARAALAAHTQQQPLPSLTQADVYGQELFAASGSTGMVLVIVRGRGVYVHGFGETAVGSRVAPTGESFLRLCSLSKIFATDLLSQLSTQRIVRLDDPLQLYAPAGVTVPSRSPTPGEQERLITLGDLATHTSGLPREVGWAPNGTPHFTFPDYEFRWHWVPTQHLRKVPGTAALYSNIGFDLLGDAMARATKEPYATLFASRITQPLGMRETTFSPTPAQCDRLLHGAHNQGPCTDTQMSAASAGAYSTGNDMATFLKYLLGTWAPEVPAQSPAAQAIYVSPSMLTHQSGLEHAGAVTGIGLGWMHTPGRPTDLEAPAPPPEASDIVEKTGGGAGFLTYIAVNHEANTALFLAVTEGRRETHMNVFRAANNLLLTLDGQAPLPQPTPVVRAVSRTGRRGAATRQPTARRAPAGKAAARAGAKKPAAHKPVARRPVPSKGKRHPAR